MVTAITTAQDETISSGQLPGRKAASCGHKAGTTVRKCLVTGETKPKEALIRFVLDPAHKVIPDLAERLPGRGLWVSATHEAIQAAVNKKLFSRAAKASARAEADLPDQVGRLLARRCLDLLGLARSAGAVVTGQPQVEDALKKGGLTFVLMASDAGRDVLRKLSQALIVRSGFTSAQLGEALGREHLVALGLRPHTLSTKLHAELMRWQGVCVHTSPTLENRPDSEQS